jgi:hypothetical protein
MLGTKEWGEGLGFDLGPLEPSTRSSCRLMAQIRFGGDEIYGMNNFF